MENQRIAYDTARTAYDVAKAAVAFAQANENDTVVRAPFDGIVTVKVAQVGEVVAPSAAGGGDTRTGIVTIVDMNSLEGLIDVSENYIDRVDVGGEAVIHLDAYPDWDIPGSVIAIIPTADQSKGTVQVRVAIKSKDQRILPEMAARVTFMTAPVKGATNAVARVTVPPQCGAWQRKNGQRLCHRRGRQGGEARGGAGAEDVAIHHHPVGHFRGRPAGGRQSRQAA